MLFFGVVHGWRRNLHHLALSGVVAAAACKGEISDSEAGGPNPGGIVTPGGQQTSTFVASSSLARRLSQAEIDNSLRDILGDTTRPAQQFLLEDEFAPYDNDYTLQQASRALIDSVEALAEDVATRTLADPARRARVVPCTTTGAGDAACFRQVISSMGRRLLRRPLTDAEIDRYAKLQAFAVEPGVGAGFDTAVELLLRSLLQDPEFLYRVESGTPLGQTGVYRLDDYAIAARLSYLLWGTTPDDALLDRAAQGGLSSAAERRQVAEAMLQDPRAREQVHRFHAQWLGYRAIPHDASLVAEFNQETTKLLDRVVFEEKRNYLDVFLSSETHLTSRLATHYGLPAPPGGAGWVQYGASGRAGILSHGSVLAAFSKFSDTSPTQRGIFVRARLLCEKISPPPANVDVDQPPGDADQVCKFDRYAEHRAIPSCAVCHDKMDSIGFGLENYDVAGRFREHDDGLPQCSIAGEGSVAGLGAFEGPAELARMIVDSKQLEACVVRQLYSFAVGRELETDEQEAVGALLEWFRSKDFAFDQLLLAYVESPAFVLRKEPRE